jgi:hypothetical protein
LQKKKWLVIAKLAEFTMVQGANKNTKGKAEIFAEILPDPPPPPPTHLQ